MSNDPQTSNDDTSEQDQYDPPADAPDAPSDGARISAYDAYSEQDVDAALAALASLQQLTAEADRVDATGSRGPETALADDADTPETVATSAGKPDDDLAPPPARRSTKLRSRRSSAPDYASAPMPTMQRGQAASAIPALLLIVIGTWLTLTLTTGGTVGDLWVRLGLIGGGAGLALLAHWVTSQRTAVGSFFVGAALLTLTGVAVVLLQPGAPGPATGWPLLLSAMGAAFILTRWLNRRARRMGFVGGVLMCAGVVGFMVTGGWLDLGHQDWLLNGWPILMGVLALVLISPVLRGLRR